MESTMFDPTFSTILFSSSFKFSFIITISFIFFFSYRSSKNLFSCSSCCSSFYGFMDGFITRFSLLRRNLAMVFWYRQFFYFISFSTTFISLCSFKRQNSRFLLQKVNVFFQILRNYWSWLSSKIEGSQRVLETSTRFYFTFGSKQTGAVILLVRCTLKNISPRRFNFKIILMNVS